MSGGVEIIPLRHEHEAFVLDTFRRCLSAEKEAWARVPQAVRGVARVLRDPAAVTALAFPVGHSDDYLGWAVAHRGALVFAYVRHVVRRKGIGAALVESVIGGAKQIPLCYWTRIASRIAAKDGRLRHDLDAAERVEGMAK